MKILVLNSGSSSQKACLYEIGNVLLIRFPWPGYVEDFDLVVEPVIKNM